MIGCCAGQSWNNSAGAGDHNVFIGSKSGNVTSGACNAAVGMCAGSGSGGSHNADLGFKAGYDSWGNYNVNIGWCAGSGGSGHRCNVSVGGVAGKSLTYGGDLNTFLGFGAGCGYCIRGLTVPAIGSATTDAAGSAVNNHYVNPTIIGLSLIHI